ncbi:unnamed protein product [Arctogadus glacialis]
MSFHYGQGYPGGTHPPPGSHGSHYGAASAGPAASPYGGAGGAPYAGYGAPAQGVPYGQGPRGPSAPYAGGHPQAGHPQGGHPQGGHPQAGHPQAGHPQAGHPQGGPYGGYGAQPQGGSYGHQGPAGNVPPGVSPEAFQWFQTVDTDHSGSITLKELKQALVNSNWSAFSDETCLMMINMFDRTRTGRIDVFGFSSLWGFMQQWRALFQQYDRDRSGTINGTELHQALGQMGYNLSPQFTETLVGRYAVRGGRPGVQLDRFIQVCTQLQSMTQAFRERDQAMTGNVRLSYEDFLSGTVQRLM